MIDVYGDLWEEGKHADAICVTTNAYVRKDGTAAMTAGCALEATQRWALLDGLVGVRLMKYGNHVHCIIKEKNPLSWIVTYPVKDHFRDRADYDLIKRSAQELRELADRMDWSHIVLPRPGCGYGHRTWDVVRPMIEDVLDDRFYAVTWKANEVAA